MECHKGFMTLLLDAWLYNGDIAWSQFMDSHDFLMIYDQFLSTIRECA